MEEGRTRESWTRFNMNRSSKEPTVLLNKGQLKDLENKNMH